MTIPVLKRGGVYWADLEPKKGSEQGGRRPVVIIQIDQLNRTGSAGL